VRPNVVVNSSADARSLAVVDYCVLLYAKEIGADVMKLAAGMEIRVDASSWTCACYVAPRKSVPMWWNYPQGWRFAGMEICVDASSWTCVCLLPRKLVPMWWN
jgi:hypothetical protein